MANMTLAETLAPPMFEREPVNFAILDSDGTILFRNGAWREFGEEIDDVIRPPETGINYLDVTSDTAEPPAPAIATHLEEILEDERKLSSLTYSYETERGRHEFEMRSNPFELGDERYVAIAHVDVTEVGNSGDIEGFRQAIEAAGHAIFITDTDGDITYVNPAFERITGYTASEALGQTPRILKSDEMNEQYYERLWRTIIEGEVWDELVINRRKSGELYYARQTIAPVVDDDGEPVEFVAIQTDISELQATRVGMQKLGTILRHDLRNELNVIQSYAELVEQRDDDLAKYTGEIVDTISELLDTTEKGIRLQRFLSSTHRPRRTEVETVLRGVVEGIRTEFPQARVEFDVQSDRDEPSFEALALDELEIALEEFVQNAIEHNDSDHPSVDITLEATAEWIVITVADDGPGIAEMEYETLESATPTNLYHNTGFGLNLAYWIVRRSGGRLTFEDNEPRGTVVTVELPRA